MNELNENIFEEHETVIINNQLISSGLPSVNHSFAHDMLEIYLNKDLNI